MTSPDPQLSACCTPRRTAAVHAESAAKVVARHGTHLIEQCHIPAGAFRMGDHLGDGLPGDGETPVHEVTLDAYAIDTTTVTNADFARFAGDTGYCTEAEWERASRGGLDGARYPWGDELLDDGWRVNIWQGTFPRHNTAEDGWPATAPVRTYRPNAFGLWQTVGNVWEWCEDPFDPRAYAKRARMREPAHNPRSRVSPVLRVLRGGSYLCHDSYCNRYRNAARSSNTPDSSMGNAGFRTVAL
ncbi:SUMF1/EgtB/PvdO family nonheme iron enzyme [Nonomuraea sp. NPDC049695]|uniref:formylglycine-generating enzyme family protein n=1 Tax=Nonomuraea sp. NPDC049695 TaxID=3154734 RepID=UPI003449ECB9